MKLYCRTVEPFSVAVERDAYNDHVLVVRDHLFGREHARTGPIVLDPHGPRADQVARFLLDLVPPRRVRHAILLASLRQPRRAA